MPLERRISELEQFIDKLNAAIPTLERINSELKAIRRGVEPEAAKSRLSEMIRLNHAVLGQLERRLATQQVALDKLKAQPLASPTAQKKSA